ncbi:SgcJ/EcaC family oxidoreductase [Micromonospora nigra]|nr:SgcJ/EcaC family oxidoreductase [Micromonospora nigra]
MTEQTEPAVTDADKAAVAGLTQRIVTAWAGQDADAFARVFTEDGTMILPGVYCRGRQEIQAFMTGAFAGPYQGTRVTGQPFDVRFLGADIALLLTQGGVMAPGETEVAPERGVRASWLAVKRQGEWQLAAYQNSPLN